ncbi:siderophore-interacting protein [Okibacterium endophyticum]
MLTQSQVKDARPAYRPFIVTVAQVRRLSPHFSRITLAGDELGIFGTDGLDQRVKLILPDPEFGLCDIGARDPQTIADGTWYSRWRELPDDRRSPFRTYTVRAVRQAEREVDVDMVVHPVDESAGPAARWLAGASVGDELILVGPDARSIDSHVGIDWQPGDADQLLLVGDETAAPAICAILESLPPGRTAHAFIEVPDAADRLELSTHDACAVTWLARGDAEVGSALDPAVRRWVADNRHVYRSALSASAQQLDDVDVDTALLWDSFGEPIGGGFYAWLAGEASVIKTLRRHLVSETGIDRKRISFMGYWRLGRAEAQ